MTLSGCPWISAAFFLETSVAFFFFPFSCLHTTPSGKRKRNDTHFSLIPNSSHPFHLPACGQSFGKGFLLFYLLSQQKNVIIFFVTDYWLYHSSALLRFSCNSWNNKTHLEKNNQLYFHCKAYLDQGSWCWAVQHATEHPHCRPAWFVSMYFPPRTMW